MLENFDKLVSTAQVHVLAGRFDVAENVYRQLIEQSSPPVEAFHGLGALLARRGEFGEALPLLRRALEASPNTQIYWMDYASSLLLADKPDEAHYVAQLARKHGIKGEELDGLEKRIEPRLALHPDYVGLRQAFLEAESNNEYAAVEAKVRNEIARFGQRPRLIQFLGTVLLRQHRNVEAWHAFEQALKGDVPDRPMLFNQYGIVLNRLGRYDQARAVFEEALRIQPDNPATLVNFADNCNDQKQYDSAVPLLDKALSISAGLPEARLNLAIARRGQGRLRESMEILDALVAEGRGSSSVTILRAAVLFAMGNYAQAIQALRAADSQVGLGSRPDLAMVAVPVLLAAGEHGMCRHLLQRLRPKAAEQPAIIPDMLFNTAFLGGDPTDLQLAKLYGQSLMEGIEPFESWPGAAANKPLRIGVVSADLRQHPVAQFFESVLAASRGRVEWLAYSNLPASREDMVTQRLIPLFTAWRRIAERTDDQVAHDIRADGVDILIDLSGYTEGQRLGVFARRPAPLQLSWIGYFGTTGVPTIDYVLADSTGVPKARSADFTEQVARLPVTRLCFTPPVDAPDVSKLPALERGHITFGSFQRVAKFTDTQLQLWAQVLHATPASRLRLQAPGLDDAAFVEMLALRLKRCGIDPERVEFHGPVAWQHYLHAYAEVDMVLDTFPYPGGTTTCEALWMGVPTVTLLGDTQLERQGGSLLKAAGLSRWVAHTPQEFVKRAITLAGDMHGLAQLRQGMRQRLVRSALCDARSFARELESTLRALWQRTARPRLQRARAASGMAPLTVAQANEMLQKAVCLYESGDSARARPLTARLVEQFPGQAVLWKVHGAVLAALAEHEPALQAKRRAVELDPNDADALANLGNSLQDADELDEAEACLRRALEIAPGHLNALNNLGMVLFRLFRYQEAREVLERALQLQPEFPAALVNYANVLRDLKLIDEAEAAYKKAIELNPRSVIAHMNLGVLYSERDPKRPMLAEASFLRALEENPRHVETLVKLGELYRELKRFLRSQECFSRATEIDPGHARAWVGLAGVMAYARGNLDEAIPCLELALEKDPSMLYVRSSLLFNHGYTDKVSPEEHLRHARLYGEGIAKNVVPVSGWNPPATPPLRLGLIGGDFRAHPVGYFLENILKYLDGSKIELFVYSNNPYDDHISEALAALIPNWRNVHGVSVKKVVDYIRDENLHVLIDLAGHTGYNRLDVFPYRPAPVQATWLGFFSTTGVQEIDWIIADPTGVPQANQGHFTEKVWYVPHTRLCFTPPRTELPVTPLPALSNGFVSFGCVQNLTKITDAAIALWGQILARVPGAMLRVQAPQFADMSARDDFRARLARHGIDARRALLLKPTPREEYLSLLRENDFLLDSFPYPGGTTTCEALWMGVPTLTLAGNTLLARQGASLMTAAGLPEWVVDTHEAYVEKAVAFASDLDALSKLRSALRDKVAESPLFDGALFARNLEDAVYGMWQHYCDNTNDKDKE